jgi:hypothetical protein
MRKLGRRRIIDRHEHHCGPGPHDRRPCADHCGTCPHHCGPCAHDCCSCPDHRGDDVAEILDLECDQGWAGAYYTDNAGLSRPAILEAEGEFWILQDWNEVCQGDPMVPGDIAVPESLRVYCPGG